MTECIVGRDALIPLYPECLRLHFQKFSAKGGPAVFRFDVNPESEIPIYRQLVDQINARIRSGAIPTGTQLPTVREMAEQMRLSCGTVKRAYDRLQELGDIEMTRRRGTFVKYVRQDGDSRKLQAMTAIDRMIRQLSDLNFSPAEIEIFLNLKMREWELKWSGVRISVVTDAVELGCSIERQLSQMGNVRLSICSLKQLREYPYSIDEQSDVILASEEDAPKISSILPDAEKLVRVAFSLRPECAFALAACAGKRLGVWGEEAFAALAAAQLPESMRAELKCCRTQAEAAAVDCLVVAADMPLENVLQGMEDKVLRLDYGIDRGSLIYLEERIGRIRTERQLQPGGRSYR